MLLDILPEIFQNLSVKDLLRCRQVCRAWRYVVDRNLSEELCLYVRGAYAPDVWVLDCKPIDPKSVLTVHSLVVLADPNFLKLFGNLKRLVIKCLDSHENKEAEMLTSLNQLDKLEHLEFHGVRVGNDFELNLAGLEKFYLDYPCGIGSIRLAKPLPSSLETFGQYEWPFSDPFVGLENQLKVLISRDFSRAFLRLINLERLHVTFLDMEDDKPRVFVARLPKLVLLDIFHIDIEEHMNELLEEVANLKPARNVKFYHQGIDSSVYVNERRQTPDLFEHLCGMKNGGGCIDLKRMLSVAQQNPEMILPFCYFQRTFIFCNVHETSLSRPFSFELLKNFPKNINKISLGDFLSYDELRNLLTNFKHILVFTLQRDQLDQAFDRFFEDLPSILENLVILMILTGEDEVLERLNFLDGFKHLLGFRAMWRENEENRITIQTIEERKKNMKFPILAEAFKPFYGYELECKNFLK